MIDADVLADWGQTAEELAEVEQLDPVYERLSFDLDDGDKGNSLSGWQCRNPYYAEFFGAVKERSKSIDYAKYTYFDGAGVVSARRFSAARNYRVGRDPRLRIFRVREAQHQTTPREHHGRRPLFWAASLSGSHRDKSAVSIDRFPSIDFLWAGSPPERT